MAELAVHSKRVIADDRKWMRLFLSRMEKFQT